MTVELELLKNEMIAVRFEYDPALVARLKILRNRRWNPGKKRWEVHLAHLAELLRIFSLRPEEVSPDILAPFEQRWAGGPIRVELSALRGRLAGASIPHEAIDAATSFFVPGHRFSPKFKAKQWDGKRHLFDSRSLKFPAGLWPRIRSVLDKAGLEYALEEQPRPHTEAVSFSTPPTELRDYQRRALRSALKKGRGIVQLATGGGKTLLAAHMIARFGEKTLFFVHTKELLHQAAGVFERELGIEVGRLGDGFAEIGLVTVATLQTTARIFGLTLPSEARTEGGEKRVKEKPTRIGPKREEIRAALQEAGLVIFDECHHVPADTAYKIALGLPAAHRRFGLSATPWRDDQHDLLLEAALGEKVCEIRSSDLIESGYLVRPRITMEPTAGVTVAQGRVEYSEIYRMAIVENQSRNRAIAARARKWAAQGRSVLILVAQIAHGRALIDLLPEARFAHGNLETDLRRRYLLDLERKLHPILIATTLADEGLDIPSLDALILAGGGKSATKAYQRIGRALRPAPGKTEALVLDFLDRAPYLDQHSQARLELYRHEPAFEIEISDRPS